MADLSDSPKVVLDPTIDFIAGTVAGITGLAVGYPFDTVKVRFQSPQIAGKYHSTAHALATIIREERFIGLYKGFTSPLATCAFMNGLVFASYRVFLRMQLNHENDIPSLTQIALAGAGSGIVCSIITTPTELVKIQQQNMLSPGGTTLSTSAVALQIYRRYGIQGLYRGITSTALRDCGYGAYFAAYEATLRYFSSPSTAEHHEGSTRGPPLSWAALLLAGGIAGIAGWLATFPFDVVKTRMQGSGLDLCGPPHPASGPSFMSSTDRTRLLEAGSLKVAPALGALSSPSAAPAIPSAHGGSFNPYQTTRSTVVSSYRAEGLSVFFRGLVPTIIRAIPVNMVTFATFEVAVLALTRWCI